jgi:hypothetical protein
VKVWAATVGSGMEPEDDCFWIYGTNDQQILAFTPAGIEYRHGLLAEHKSNQSFAWR